MLYVGMQTALKCHREESAKGQIGRLSGSKKKKINSGIYTMHIFECSLEFKGGMCNWSSMLIWFPEIWGLALKVAPGHIHQHWTLKICPLNQRNDEKHRTNMTLSCSVQTPMTLSSMAHSGEKCTPRGLLWPGVLHSLPRTRKWADRTMTNWMKASSIVILLICKVIRMKNVLHNAFLVRSKQQSRG